MQDIAGLVAALAASLVSYFPAYYVSWGRYTQLTAMILLPAAIVCTMLALESRPSRKRYLVLAAFFNYRTARNFSCNSCYR